MARLTTEIMISGAGVAGLTAACLFATQGRRVLLVDPIPPVLSESDPEADLRSTAFLQPARNTLELAGLWDRFKPFAAPLQIMRLADSGGAEFELRYSADFDASDISDLPFAWNLPNWLLRRELMGRLAELPNVTFLQGVKTEQFTPRSEQALIALSNGDVVSADLVIAADGRNSALREMAGIGAKTWTYGQKALVFCISHSRPHGDVSTEIHRSGGPFTLVPMPSVNGEHRSSVVWMETSENAERLAAMSDAEFNLALNDRGCGVLGDLKLITERKVWPIISRLADRLNGPRLALMAEAGHVIPPIGAQGLNMSLTDLQTLSDLLEGAEDIGNADLLAKYNRARWWDVKTRVTGVDLLNRAAMTDSENLKALRLKGLQALYGIEPLRKSVMRLGLGAV